MRVRNTGTLGGNLAFAEPHSDPATFLLACDATRAACRAGAARASCRSASSSSGRCVTAREADEILVAVDVPARSPGEGRAYEKLAFFERPAASVAVRLRVDGGSIAEAARRRRLA